MVLPFGRFQWTQLPMGTVVVQDIFQSKLDSIFIGMEGITGIADDMVIAGRDKMEHDRNFLAFMEKYEQQPNSQLRKDTVQAVTGIFLWPLLVETWNCIRSQENSGTDSYGVPTRQGNYEIFPRYDQLPQQIFCAQCTPCCIPQCTHTSGHRLQAR